MQFNVRDMFALMFIVALAALVVGTMRQHWIAGEELGEARSRLDSQRMNLQILQTRNGNPQAQVDWLKSKAIFKRSGIEHLPSIQEKYSRIEPRGEGFVSIRIIPMIVDAEYDGSNWRMRMLVPEGSEPYLKLGVIDEKFAGFRSILPADSLLLDDSFLDNSGPFEIRLTPGIHDIDLARRKEPKDSLLQYRFSLDGRPILVSTSEFEGVTSKATMFTAAYEQIDLPITGGSVLGKWSFGGSTGPEQMLLLWFDETSSGFSPFPGEEEP